MKIVEVQVEAARKRGVEVEAHGGGPRTMRDSQRRQEASQARGDAALREPDGGCLMINQQGACVGGACREKRQWLGGGSVALLPAVADVHQECGLADASTPGGGVPLMGFDERGVVRHNWNMLV